MYMYVTKDGDFVGLDKASGGYPYVTSRPFSAHLWPTKEEAENYLSKSELKKGWILKRFDGLKLADA